MAMRSHATLACICAPFSKTHFLEGSTNQERAAHTWHALPERDQLKLPTCLVLDLYFVLESDPIFEFPGLLTACASLKREPGTKVISGADKQTPGGHLPGQLPHTCRLHSDWLYPVSLLPHSMPQEKMEKTFLDAA